MSWAGYRALVCEPLFLVFCQCVSLEAVPGTRNGFFLIPVKISATIITLNEEGRLDRCLESIEGVVDEIIVVDSGSTDRTLAIAAAQGATVLTRAWTNYSEQKNYAASQASCDWILSLDADECLSDELKREILGLKSAAIHADAFRFPRMALYLGKWIRFSGWYPDYKVRLYHKSKASWEGSYVHETLLVNGTIESLKGDLLHYTCDSLSEHINRLDRYTTLAAQDLYSRGKPGSLFQLIISPLLAFVRSLFIKSGFRDGVQGYTIAYFASFYNFLKYAKLRELKKKRSSPTKTQSR